MPQNDLLLAALGVTPDELIHAASMSRDDGDDLLGRLERSGALSGERRRSFELLLQKSVQREPLVDSTFSEPSSDEPPSIEPSGIDNGRRGIPVERDGQYRRLEELGRGAQSIVHRAIDEFIGREVAIKELRPRTAEGTLLPEPLRWRFLREARLTARLDHPGIVAVHELARRADGTLYSAQKLVRGETLKARLARAAALDDRLGLLERLVDVCQAVAYVHARGIVHRDLKPSNIMVGEYGDTVVVDWGLAKERGEAEPVLAGAAPRVDARLTMTGIALGTPSYMSPEQARGALDVDARSDVFSLGVILYEILTGRLPFEGTTAEQVIGAVIDGRFPRVREHCPEAPAELAAVAERAIAHDPAQRYENAGAVAAELRAYRSGRRVAAYEYRSWELLRKFVARNRTVTAVSVAAVALLIGASVVIAWELHQTRASLAASFIERAHAAEQGFDWARAAGYYAASRIERDTREARWGFALARGKVLRRSSVQRGGEGELMAPGFLPDGRGVVAGLEGHVVVLRELDGGRELWRTDVREGVSNLVVWSDYVRSSHVDRYRYLDLMTGRLVAENSAHESDRCRAAPLSSRTWLRRRRDRGFDLVAGPSGAVTLVEHVMVNNHCTVSPSGDRVAVFDGKDVRIFDQATLAELASRPALDAQNLRFTAHGLAVVRGAAVQLFGGDDGDFLIALPSSGADVKQVPADPGVSPDGHIVVIPRQLSTQVDLVDLRLRAVVGSLTVPPGSPRFAISPDGSRLVIANLVGASLLAQWDLRAILRPPAGFASGTGTLMPTRSGRFLNYAGPKALNVLDADGRLIHSFSVPTDVRSRFALSPDGTRLAIYQADTVSIYDCQTFGEIARFECPQCDAFSLSNDGRRFLGYNHLNGLLQLWNVADQTVLWSVMKKDPDVVTGGLAFDGQKVLYNEGNRLHVVDVDRSTDVTLPYNGMGEAAFSKDSTRVAIADDYAVTVWKTDGSGPEMRVRTQESGNQRISWSNDDSALMHWTDGFGGSLLDSRTGERFVLMWMAKPVGLSTVADILSDLRTVVSRTGDTWQLSTLAPPDESSPRDSLARILAETGLELNGVELVNAVPGPR